MICVYCGDTGWQCGNCEKPTLPINSMMVLRHVEYGRAELVDRGRTVAVGGLQSCLAAARLLAGREGVDWRHATVSEILNNCENK